VSAIARARSFQGRRQIHLAACFKKGPSIVLPRRFVEVGGNKKAGFIQ
jgi:hypothetical protein